MKRLQLQLIDGYRLTTAEILYRLPDYPHLLQSFIWQELDIAPRFPVLRRFLDFWSGSLEGRLYSVKVSQAPPLVPTRLSHAQISLSLH